MFAATTLRAGEGSDPLPPNTNSLAAAIPLEGLGRRSRALGAAPDDLLTSYPGTGRKSALLGRVRTCQSACLVSTPTSGRPRTSASPHPGPALTLGWSVHHARRGIRTTAPGSCAEGRFQDRRASHLRGTRRKPHPAAPVMLRLLTSSTPKTYPRPFLRTGIAAVGRNKATAALRRSLNSWIGAIRLTPIAPYIACRRGV